MGDFARLLSGIADLAWPVVAGLALILFKADISKLLGRLRRGKVLGQELELDPELDELEKKVKEARSEVSERLEGAPEPSEPNGKDAQDRATKVLNEAVRSPPAALMALSREIERLLRQLVAALPFEIEYARKPLVPLLSDLQRTTGGVVPSDLFESVRDFWRIRSRVVHGTPVQDREVLRAIDIGLALLDSLVSYPHQRQFVSSTKIPLFEDEACSRQRPDVWGVLLKAAPTGAPQDVSERIFPTTKPDQYQPGKAVSWEWNPDRKWGETWYQDPDTHDVRYAWTSSTEFSGRHLEEI